MFRQSPKYTVTTLALVVIAVAAFGLKFASQYLPERRPNKLGAEYGEYLRRSMRQNVDWFPFGSLPFMQAKKRDKVVLLELGSTMSLSAKLFSEDFATDGEYRQLLHDHFEAIKVDLLERPWVADAMAVDVGPIVPQDRFRIIAMTPDGKTVRSTFLLAKDGDQSLAAWLAEIARLRYSNPEELKSIAGRSAAMRRSKAAAALIHGAAGVDDVAAWSHGYEAAASTNELVKNERLVSTLPMEVLLASPNSDAWGPALGSMLALAYSPCADLVDGGFFLTAYESGWRRPVTSKCTGHTLITAAAFAEASVRFRLPLFRFIAAGAAKWALRNREAGLFQSGIGTDQTAAGFSPYFSFEAFAIDDTPFDITEQGVPYVKDVASFAEAISQGTTEEIGAAARKLRIARQQKPAPRVDSATYADLNGQAVSGVLRIGLSLNDPELIAAGLKAFEAMQGVFVQPLGDVRHVPAATPGSAGYCADYAWFVRAALEAYRATGKLEILEAAEQTTSRMLELFQDTSGALMSYLPSEMAVIGFGFPVFSAADTEIASTNAVAAMSLSDLAAITGDRSYFEQAGKILRAFAGGFADLGAPAGFVLAGRRLYGEYVLTNGVVRSSQPKLGEKTIVFPAPPGRIKGSRARVRQAQVLENSPGSRSDQ
jgi:uncharacterized protein YyaL (SSP411 family)